jgi:hypothetical protein
LPGSSISRLGERAFAGAEVKELRGETVAAILDHQRRELARELVPARTLGAHALLGIAGTRC